MAETGRKTRNIDKPAIGTCAAIMNVVAFLMLSYIRWPWRTAPFLLDLVTRAQRGASLSGVPSATSAVNTAFGMRRLVCVLRDARWYARCHEAKHARLTCYSIMRLVFASDLLRAIAWRGTSVTRPCVAAPVRRVLPSHGLH